MRKLTPGGPLLQTDLPSLPGVGNNAPTPPSPCPLLLPVHALIQKKPLLQLLIMPYINLETSSLPEALDKNSEQDRALHQSRNEFFLSLVWNAVKKNAPYLSLVRRWF